MLSSQRCAAIFFCASKFTDICLIKQFIFSTISVCNANNRCGSCWPGHCFSIANYTLYKVREHGQVSGLEKMKAEIFHHGPIACGIAATLRFEGYQGGVYSEKTTEEIDHIISVCQ